MANYSYYRRNMRNHAWIKCLRIVTENSMPSAHWTEIHFTEPKDSQVNTNLRPHVTFVRTNGARSHWYLKNTGGAWALERRGTPSPDNGLESEIAYAVLDDAQALNWIRQPPPSRVMDDEGFSKVETKQGRRRRMQTGWRR